MTPSLRTNPYANRSRGRGLACGVLALGLFALSGCGMHLVGHRIGLPLRGPGAGLSELESNVLEARTQSTLQPREPYWLFHVGQLYLAADSLAAAEAALHASLARDAHYPSALALLSKLYFDTGRHSEAVKLLEPVRTSPETFSNEARQVLLAGLALHYDALGRPDLASEVTRPIARPDLERAGAALVYVQLRGSSPDSADALASATLRQAPKSAVNLNNFGITRLRAGDPVAARKAFLSAIDRDSKLAGPYYNLAILEKYYLLDDAAATRWFSAYWKRSQADPDSLSGALAADRKDLAEKRN